MSLKVQWNANIMAFWYLLKLSCEEMRKKLLILKKSWVKLWGLVGLYRTVLKYL